MVGDASRMELIGLLIEAWNYVDALERDGLWAEEDE